MNWMLKSRFAPNWQVKHAGKRRKRRHTCWRRCRSSTIYNRSLRPYCPPYGFPIASLPNASPFSASSPRLIRINASSSAVRGDVDASFIAGFTSGGGVVDAGVAAFGSLPERVTTEMTVNTTPAMMAEGRSVSILLLESEYFGSLTDCPTSRIPFRLLNLGL